MRRQDHIDGLNEVLASMRCIDNLIRAGGAPGAEAHLSIDELSALMTLFTEKLKKHIQALQVLDQSPTSDVA